MSGYPVMLRLDGRSCVVVGGGQVAARKVEGLLDAGAKVTVISPSLCPALSDLWVQGKIDARQIPYAPGMLAGFNNPLLVFAATDEPETNRQVAEECQHMGVLVNTADRVDDSDFMNMAIVRHGSITITISSEGGAPALTAHLKQRLEDSIGEEYMTLANWMVEFRPQVRVLISNQAARQALWQAVIDSKVLDHLRRGEQELARAQFEALIAEAREQQP